MTNCRIEKIYYGELLKASWRFLLNDKVEMLETGLDVPETFSEIYDTRA
jgi:hypothetical protein